MSLDLEAIKKHVYQLQVYDFRGGLGLNHLVDVEVPALIAEIEQLHTAADARATRPQQEPWADSVASDMLSALREVAHHADDESGFMVSVRAAIARADSAARATREPPQEEDQVIKLKADDIRASFQPSTKTISIGDLKFSLEHAHRIACDIFELIPPDSPLKQLSSDPLTQLVEKWRTDRASAACIDGNSDDPCDGIKKCADDLESILEAREPQAPHTTQEKP